MLTLSDMFRHVTKCEENTERNHGKKRKNAKRFIQAVLLMCHFFVQGHPMQTVFFETALTDRNIKVKFALKLVLEC